MNAALLPQMWRCGDRCGQSDIFLDDHILFECEALGVGEDWVSPVMCNPTLAEQFEARLAQVEVLASPDGLTSVTTIAPVLGNAGGIFQFGLLFSREAGLNPPTMPSAGREKFTLKRRRPIHRAPPSTSPRSEANPDQGNDS